MAAIRAAQSAKPERVEVHVGVHPAEHRVEIPGVERVHPSADGLLGRYARGPARARLLCRGLLTGRLGDGAQLGSPDWDSEPAGLARARGLDASENSRSSAVIKNSACSAMSTALSPIRSSDRAIRT